MKPESVDAAFQLAVFFDRHHDTLPAIAAFQQALKLNPNNQSACDYLALNLEAVSDLSAAEAAYKSGFAIKNPTRPDNFLSYNYARFLMKANRLPESKSYLDEAVVLSPESRAVHYERAKLNLLLREYANAEKDATLALTLEPRSQYIRAPQIYALLATIYGRLGNAEQAHLYASLARSTKVVSDGTGRQ